MYTGAIDRSFRLCMYMPNAVPSTQGFAVLQGQSAQPHASSSGRKLDDVVGNDGAIDTRPILLFDLNGTLTSHTSQRRSAGRNKLRPGTHHLRRLQVREHVPTGI